MLYFRCQVIKLTIFKTFTLCECYQAVTVLNCGFLSKLHSRYHFPFIQPQIGLHIFLFFCGTLRPFYLILDRKSRVFIQAITKYVNVFSCPLHRDKSNRNCLFRRTFEAFKSNDVFSIEVRSWTTNEGWVGMKMAIITTSNSFFKYVSFGEQCFKLL